MEQKYYTLSQLSLIIKETFATVFDTALWIKAEINEMHEHTNRNCYLELIEKDNVKDRIIARFRAIIWSDRYFYIKRNFENATGSKLTSGLSVLCKVSVEFSELYGVTLIILDIDPSYTLGEWEQRRLQILKRLEEEGIAEMNKEIEIPLVPQNIALISSKNAAGCQDFFKHLYSNQYKFKYNVVLFEANMQGEGVEQSIIDALDRIVKQKFDVVVIARGGGSKADLAAFDSYRLAYHICQFPLPVISAIGHERDYSVIDYVANTRAKTPTDAAAIIIEKTLEYWNFCVDYSNKIISYTQSFLNTQFKNFSYFSNTILKVKQITDRYFYYFKNFSYNFKYRVQYILKNQHNFLENIDKRIDIVRKSFFRMQFTILSNHTNRIKIAVTSKLTMFNNKLIHFEKQIASYDPINVLKKGYTLTYKNGKIIKTKIQLNTDDIITTKFFDGEINSKVI